jgi:quercetin dioxygenase-like cupin family protein
MQLQKQRFETDGRREEYLDGSIAELARVGGRTVVRATFLPGHRWSQHVKPIAGTPSCEQGHVGYIVAGRFRVVMDDGEEEEFGPGDLYSIPPGHDAEILGEEPCVCVDIGPPAQRP